MNEKDTVLEAATDFCRMLKEIAKDGDRARHTLAAQHLVRFGRELVQQALNHVGAAMREAAAEGSSDLGSGRSVYLSRIERTFLINQLEILQALTKEDRSQEIEILRAGYEIFYSDALVREATMSSDESSFVLTVLSMFRAIDDYLHNNAGDAEIAKHPWAKFHGFSGNDEGQYLAFTRFLIERQGKFTEQEANRKATDNFNSHFPMLETYERMVAVWRRSIDNRGTPLSRAQILEILGAAEARA